MRIKLRQHTALVALATLYPGAQAGAKQQPENAVDAIRRLVQLLRVPVKGEVLIKAWKVGPNNNTLQITDNGHGMNPVIGRYSPEIENFNALQASKRSEQITWSDEKYDKEYDTRWIAAAPGLCSFEYVATNVSGSAKEGSRDQRGQKGIGFWSWLTFATAVTVRSKAHPKIALPERDLPPNNGKVGYWELQFPSRSDIYAGTMDFPNEPVPVYEPLLDALGRPLAHGTSMLFQGITDDIIRAIMLRLDVTMAREFEVSLETGLIKMSIINQLSGKAVITDVTPNTGAVDSWYIEELYEYPPPKHPRDQPGEKLQIRIGYDDKENGGIRLFYGELPVGNIAEVPELNIEPFNHPKISGRIQIPRTQRAKIQLKSSKDGILGDGVPSWARYLIAQYGSRVSQIIEIEREQLTEQRRTQLRDQLQAGFAQAIDVIKQLHGVPIDFLEADEGSSQSTDPRNPLTNIVVAVKTKLKRNIAGAEIRISRVVMKQTSKGPKEVRIPAVTRSGEEIKPALTGKDGKVVLGEVPVGTYDLECFLPSQYASGRINTNIHRFTTLDTMPGYWYRFVVTIDEPPRATGGTRVTPFPNNVSSPDAPSYKLDFLHFAKKTDRYIIQDAKRTVVINLSTPMLAQAVAENNGKLVGALVAKYCTSAMTEMLIREGEGENWGTLNRNSDAMYEVFMQYVASLAEQAIGSKRKR